VRVLITGAGGQVGQELVRAFAGHDVVAATSADLDITDRAMVLGAATSLQPDTIVHAGAFTAVDACEAESDRAYRVNALGTRNVADAARRVGAHVLYLSTDYVFDGTKPAPYDEWDVPNPQSVYGRSKLDGEEAIRASGCRHLILRTAWVYASRGGNFAKTMLRLAAERDRLTVVDDQIGAPTGADLLADISAHVLRRARADESVAGTYHAVAAGETSWHGYARHVIAYARGLGEALRVADDAVLPVPSSAFPTPARRPLNSRLDTRKLRDTFDLHLPDWRIGVERMLVETHPVRQPVGHPVQIAGAAPAATATRAP